MNLSPQERDKLLIYIAAQVAKDRKKRGLKLNVPEAMALITAELMEMARDGKTVAEIMSAGREILKKSDVMEGVAEMIPMIQVEPTFPDGSKLVTTWTSDSAVAGKKVVRTETRSISPDGKVMTVESVRGSNPPIVMVFEKQ